MNIFGLSIWDEIEWVERTKDEEWKGEWEEEQTAHSMSHYIYILAMINSRDAE